MNLPVMLEAVELLRKQGHDYEYLLPVASTLDSEWVRYQLGPATDWIKLTADARATVMLSRAAVVASGTATVEAALTGTPFVVVYRLSPLTWLLGRRLVSLDTFAMPNLIAGCRVVPELIQSGFTAENVVRELTAIIADGPGASTDAGRIAGSAAAPARQRGRRITGDEGGEGDTGKPWRESRGNSMIKMMAATVCVSFVLFGFFALASDKGSTQDPCNGNLLIPRRHDLTLTIEEQHARRGYADFFEGKITAAKLAADVAGSTDERAGKWSRRFFFRHGCGIHGYGRHGNKSL